MDTKSNGEALWFGTLASPLNNRPEIFGHWLESARLSAIRIIGFFAPEEREKMRRFLSVFFTMFCIVFANASVVHATQAINVDYIAQYTKQKWKVDVPYDPAQKKWAANTKYMLCVVDWVNEKINDGPTSNYCNDTEYATKQAIDTVATNYAIEKLIRREYIEFRPANSGTDFQFTLSASGKFKINWGDGVIEELEKTDTKETTISHNYADTDGNDASSHLIKITGKATGYNSSTEVAAISFSKGSVWAYTAPYPISELDGSFPAVFPQLSGGPTFAATFASNSTLREIPGYIFDGYTGGIDDMFKFLFWQGDLAYIPEGLFSSITDGANRMFQATFQRNENITSIPEPLFGDISNSKYPTYMFYNTFYQCKNLSGEPAKVGPPDARVDFWDKWTAVGQYTYYGTNISAKIGWKS